MIETTLLVLPGLDGTEIFFGPLFRHLPGWIRPIVAHYPSTGRNGYDELLRGLEKAVAEMDSFAVLAWSFGGPLALELANRHPRQVTAVILYSSFVTPPRPGLARLRPLVSAPVYAIVRALRRTRLLVPGWSTAEFRRAKAMVWRRVGSGVLAARTRAVLSLDARAQLRACRAPLMYLAATRDTVVGRASRDEVASIAPRACMVEVEGPHFALFANPGAGAGHIARFLSGVNASEFRAPSA